MLDGSQFIMCINDNVFLSNLLFTHLFDVGYTIPNDIDMNYEFVKK